MYFPTVNAQTGELTRLEMVPLLIRRFRLPHPSAAETGWAAPRRISLGSIGRLVGSAGSQGDTEDSMRRIVAFMATRRAPVRFTAARRPRAVA
jgi:hypothetical protein